MMDVAALKECLGSLSKNIYFCGIDTNSQTPTIIVKDTQSHHQVTEILNKKSVDDSSFALVTVKTTRSLGLEKTRSLEEILARVPHESIFFDPTATIERAKILVCMVKQARIHLGPVLKGCYFNSERRNIHFLLKAGSSKQKLDIAALRAELEPIILQNTQRLSKPFYYSITLSEQQPAGAVIAIDQASVINRSIKGLIRNVMNKLKWPLLVASASSSLGMGAAKASVVEQNSLPAVSNVNGWIGASAGYLHDNINSGAGGFGEAGLAAGLTHSIGLQLHAYDGGVAHTNIFSADGYVFWRNPAQGLLGPHVMYTHVGSIDQTLYGLHGEGYFDAWTLVAEAGGVHETQQNGSCYGEAILHWYVQPDLDITLGGIILDGHGGGQLGAEYQLGLSSLPGLSVFADAGVGAQDLGYGFLGVRYYFAETQKPLERRHREDMVPPTLDLLVHNMREQAVVPRFTS